MNRQLVFTAFNRPAYFAPVMASWRAARGFADWNPVVFLEPSGHQQQMTCIAEQAGAEVRINPYRRGVLSNPWHALDTAFTPTSASPGNDFVVLAEDDILVSDDVLEYFAWTSSRFRHHHILAVCATTFAPHCPAGADNDLHYTHAVNPLVWGTWADRWTQVLRDTWDHDYSSGAATGTPGGWDWNISLRVIADWQVLVPAASRGDHIGEHGGTHCTLAQFPGTRAATFTAHRPRAPFRLAP